MWVPIHAWNSVTRIDAAPAGDRPAPGKGHNYLLVGSDSRDGLTAAQRKEYRTGGDVGQRTDSIILVHTSSSGKSSLVSIPRDSYVPIPGHSSNKINAAYSLGGAKLLVQTVEQVTDLRIDGVMEIGFGGFAGLVDSVGGVWICVPFDMNDKDAGINLKKGCQTLDGKNALGYVRARHSDPRGDIGRAARQRQFLAALMKKVATPSTVLIPTRYYHTMMSIASAVRVSDDMSISDAVRVMKTLRGTSSGNTLSFTVPLSTWNYPTANAGSAVKWDTELAKQLFRDLREDKALTAPPKGTDGQPTG
ncbi:Cell envelope-related transcriptional attenuator [Nostocoides japonicum T1-X7]|uniref:Cell envelope-related transcriptional attenuator n=1 Tax=Nostocoides japonicum T1-X7 TaxID=1194083 RepID=A0A077M534_9MICO|nr:Cell envelope-related transcriptional attenuator [Tetrasphaera japonica T1-X7]